MKTQPPVPLRARLTGFVPALLVTAAFGSSMASAQTFTQRIFPITNSDGIDIFNITPSGYSQLGVTSDGSVDYTANGLVLTTGTAGGEERFFIDNVEDITGAGIQLDRYISFTLGPDNIDALDGYTGAYTVNFTQFARRVQLDTGGHFEIRTSVDNFASPLTTYDQSLARLGPAAPGLTVQGAGTILTNGTQVTTNTPLVVRLYTWFDQLGANGWLGSGVNDTLFQYQVTAVPEPSAAVLSGVAAIAGLLRRRRA